MPPHRRFLATALASALLAAGCASTTTGSVATDGRSRLGPLAPPSLIRLPRPSARGT